MVIFSVPRYNYHMRNSKHAALGDEKSWVASTMVVGTENIEVSIENQFYDDGFHFQAQNAFDTLHGQEQSTEHSRKSPKRL